VPPWTFAVDGVTSISVDLHKYAYAPKGTSILLHRTAELRRPQYFASADWPGYTMLNPTMQSTKSGGPLAGAWAVVNTIGEDGYLELTRKVLDGVDTLVAGIEAIPGLRVVVPPDSTLVAFATDDSCDAFTITDAMSAAGWYVQPQLSYAGQAPSIHLSLSPATADHLEEFLTALRGAVDAAVGSGPIRVDPGTVEFVQALDAASLSEEDFDGLLAAVGMAGGDGVGIPESMAEINALLDLATPDLREALLVAFLDRLQRPAGDAG
jgi:sphinganine-1-phosphate aldolase